MICLVLTNNEIKKNINGPEAEKKLAENFHRKKVEKNLRESSSVNVRPIIFIIFYNHEHVGTERKI